MRAVAAVLACACFGDLALQTPGRDMLRTERQATVVMVVDVRLLGDSSDGARLSVSTMDRMQLCELPLRDLKRVLEMYLYFHQQDLDDQEKADTNPEEWMEIEITAPGGPRRPLCLVITHSKHSVGRKNVRVTFCSAGYKMSMTSPKGFKSSMSVVDPAKQQQQLKPHESLTLQLCICAHCASTDECDCGWRKIHTISKSDERHHLWEVLESKLPNDVAATAMTLSCFTFCLCSISRASQGHCEAIIRSKKVVQAILEQPYVAFAMEIRYLSLKWQIRRRYRDFAELHQQLSKIFSARTMLPQLPPATWFRTLDDHFLLQRQRALSEYIKCILLVNALSTSVPVLSFLGVLSTAHLDHQVPDFCPREVMHLRVLNHYVSVGDLILFQCAGPMGALQRSVTGSEWDHVGIVVPANTTAAFHLLEATGDGVSVSPLAGRLLAYASIHIKCIALRKLQTPLLTAAVRQDLLQRFTSEVEGMPYGLSISKLLQPRSNGRGNFFCSELVAEAYKAIGLMDPNIAASNCWPGCFSSGQFVDQELARHGASLGPEIAIDCRLLEVAMARSF